MNDLLGSTGIIEFISLNSIIFALRKTVGRFVAAHYVLRKVRATQSTIFPNGKQSARVE